MAEFRHEYSGQVPARVDAVFAAMSQADKLTRWFAEHVEVSAAAGGPFRFWGKHTLGTPDGASASQTLTAFDENQRIAFRWRVLDIDSEVTWVVQATDDGDGTNVTVTHVFQEPPTDIRTREFVDDLWRLNMANLTAHMMGVEPLLPDYDDPNPEVRQSILIDAPREKVFAALIEPEHMKAWAGGTDPVAEPVEGGRYSLGWHYEMDGRTVDGGPTKIIEIVPNEKLVTDWPDWRGDPNVPAQRVTWLLADEDGKTRLTLIHDGFTRTVDISDYGFGWLYFLGNVQKVAEGKG